MQSAWGGSADEHIPRHSEVSVVEGSTLWMTVRVSPSSTLHSLQDNSIGDEGCKALGEGLRTKVTLATLEYVK